MINTKINYLNVCYLCGIR